VLYPRFVDRQEESRVAGRWPVEREIMTVRWRGVPDKSGHHLLRRLGGAKKGQSLR